VTFFPVNSRSFWGFFQNKTAIQRKSLPSCRYSEQNKTAIQRDCQGVTKVAFSGFREKSHFFHICDTFWTWAIHFQPQFEPILEAPRVKTSLFWRLGGSNRSIWGGTPPSKSVTKVAFLGFRKKSHFFQFFDTFLVKFDLFLALFDHLAVAHVYLYVSIFFLKNLGRKSH
jgi:hypothetical protein